MLDSIGNHSATANNTKLVHWPLIGGLLHLVQRAVPFSLYQMYQRPMYQSLYCYIIIIYAFITRASSVMILNQRRWQSPGGQHGKGMGYLKR